MVILAALACIELYDDESMDTKEIQLPAESIVIQTASNGLCFWTCLYLAVQASPPEVFAWFVQPRNTNGFPSATRMKEEDQTIYLWAMGLKQVFQDHHPMPEGTRHRLRNKISATHEDMDPWHS